MLTRAYNTNACMRSEHKCLHALMLSKSSKHAFNCHYRAKMLTRAQNTNACAQNTQMLACACAEQVVETRIQLSLQNKNAYTRL